MPRLDAFHGLRYDASATAMAQVIAPPYDIVGPAERAALAARSPLNAIHLELPEPDAESGADRYQAAGALLRSWVAGRILVEDTRPGLYPYRMTAPDGAETTGVLGALSIGEDVLPHEETMPKPKSDRLDLLRATRANLSPIWGLSLTQGLTATFAPAGAPLADVCDADGVRHQLWVIDDPRAVAAVRDAVAASPVVIADGHHRYETARAYRQEVRSSNGDRPGAHDAVMALVVELAEEQLHVRAIHRMVGGIPGPGLLTFLGRCFEVTQAGPATEEAIGAMLEAGLLVAVTSEGAWRLAARDGAFEAEGTDLVAGLVDVALRESPTAELSYDAQWRAVLDAVTSRTVEAGVLLQPVTVAQISSWAAARRRMPPKTTYFSPKPRTGMVFRVLGGSASL